MGRFASNEYKFRIPDDAQLSGMRMGKYTEVPSMNETLKRRARDFFKRDLILKGAYTLQLHITEVPHIQRQTMDVDFGAEMTREEFLKRVDLFCESVQELGNLRWKLNSYADALPDFTGVTLYSGEDEIFKIDFVTENVEWEYVEDGEIKILRTLADKVAVVLEGSRIFRRVKDIIDIARIISDPKIEITYDSFKTILNSVLDKNNYKVNDDFYVVNRRDIIRAIKVTRRSVIKDPEFVYELVLNFIAPLTLYSYGSNMKWFVELERWDEWH